MLPTCNLITLLIFLPLFSFPQTCIIAIRTANDIYIAADIRGNFVIDTLDVHRIRHRVAEPVSMCKINQLHNNIIFLSAGLNLKEIRPMADECINYSQTIGNLSRNFLEKVKKLYFSYYSKLDSITKETALEELHKGVEFMFCGFENGLPKISIAKVLAINRINESLKFASANYEDLGDPLPDDQTFNLVVIGARDAIIQNTKPSDTREVHGAYIEYLDKLIKLQHNSTPKAVSDSCDIIRVRADRIYWLQKTGYCPQ